MKVVLALLVAATIGTGGVALAGSASPDRHAPASKHQPEPKHAGNTDDTVVKTSQWQSDDAACDESSDPNTICVLDESPPPDH